MNCCCTIISPDYYPFARTLYQSLARYMPGAVLHVLIMGEHKAPTASLNESIHFNHADELWGHGLSSSIREKYSKTDNIIRWALKPAYISFLLEQYEKVIFLDPDLFFTANADFLFQELEGAGMLLSPHGNSADPLEDADNIAMNTRTGLYNAGMIGASRTGRHLLEWWAAAILQKMEKNESLGLFDDQRYLDMLPVLDENVRILRHKGCNLGSWNIHSNPRSIVEGQLLLNGRDPIVFIHFNQETIRQILNRNDILLLPYFETYRASLLENGYDLMKRLDHLPLKKYESASYKFRHRLRLRTRLKRWLIQVSKKI